VTLQVSSIATGSTSCPALPLPRSAPSNNEVLQASDEHCLTWSNVSECAELWSFVCRAVAAALVACLQGLHAQGGKPRTPPSQGLSTAARATGTNTVGGTLEPLTARSNTSVSITATTTGTAAGPAADAASVFSFGSDAVVEAWHRGSGVDVQGLTQLLVLLLRALHKMERWRCVLELGECCTGSCQPCCSAHALDIVGCRCLL
jgi:hypothetical protein